MFPRVTELRRLVAEMAIYAVGRAASALIPFLLVPFLTRTYTPEEFGTLEVVLVSAAIVGTIISSGLPGAYMFFVRAPSYRGATHVLLGACATWYVLWSVIVLGLLALCLPFVFHLLTARLLSGLEVGLFFGVAVTQQILVFVTAVLRMDNRAWAVVLLSVGGSLCAALLTVAFVLWQGPTIQAYLLGFTIGFGAAAIVGCGVIRPRRKLMLWSSADLGRLLAFGLPLVPSALSEVALTMADRAIVMSLLGARELAVYAVAARVASLVQLAIQSVSLALPPLKMRLLHESDREASGRLLGILWRYVSMVFLAGAVLGAMITPLLVKFLAPQAYRGAMHVAPYLMLAHVFYSFTNFMSLGALKAEKTYLYTLSVLAGAILSVAGSLALVPHLGLLGAAAGTLAGSIMTPAICLALSQRVWRLDLPLNRVIAMSGVALLACALLARAGGDGVTPVQLAVTAAAIGVMAPIAVSRADLTLLRSMNRWGSPT
ncbi:MAG: polysaccharide biosynthesis protein [Elioraea sp.]|jgi:O-antigen/teichoic acid export membrane protein|nr:MAG: polysaccharide biosynthesis protein [Elioraea sp.]